uniref:Uncharacterized protein n=1 Tax=Heterorhabditis bacteriophora TaxID=37862 RepID=A0A1I7XA36_HETBA
MLPACEFEVHLNGLRMSPAILLSANHPKPVWSDTNGYLREKSKSKAGRRLQSIAGLRGNWGSERCSNNRCVYKKHT